MKSGRAICLASHNLTGEAMTTLRDFITERQAEIKAEQAALRLESQELKAALEAINATAEQNSENGSRRPSGRATIKDCVVEALREHPGGGSAEEITAWIATAHGLTIPRSSLSPQISRLKAEGVVILNANKDWQLAEHPQYDATYYPQSLK